MDINEFNGVVTPYPHGDDELVLDVRPFGARQGEAIESYLHSRLMGVSNAGIENTDRLFVLMCDATAEIPETAMALIETLAARGQWAEIRHECPVKAFAMSA